MTVFFAYRVKVCSLPQNLLHRSLWFLVRGGGGRGDVAIGEAPQKDRRTIHGTVHLSEIASVARDLVLVKRETVMHTLMF
jgi:hypothetical protein